MTFHTMARLRIYLLTLADHHVNVDIIVQTIMEGVQPSVSFSIKKEDFAEAINVLEMNKNELGYRQCRL